MAAKEEEEDQILARLGHIGSWQWRVILVTGLFSTPTVCHTMVITFMNAEVRALGVFSDFSVPRNFVETFIRYCGLSEGWCMVPAAPSPPEHVRGRVEEHQRPGRAGVRGEL